MRVAGETERAHAAERARDADDEVRVVPCAVAVRVEREERADRRVVGECAEPAGVTCGQSIRAGVETGERAARVGYRQALAYVDGGIDAAALRERGIAATRQLAKRQLTWLRSMDVVPFECFAPDVVETVVASVAGAMAGGGVTQPAR